MNILFTLDPALIIQLLVSTVLPLVDGARSISRWRQPCYTHPEAASTIASAIRRALALVPEQPVESISSIIAK